jgi:hypothetical protein
MKQRGFKIKIEQANELLGAYQPSQDSKAKTRLEQACQLIDQRARKEVLHNKHSE